MATLNKRDAVVRLIKAINRLDSLCAKYQTYSGNVENRLLFDFMELIDTTLATAQAAHAELAGVLTNPQINSLLDDYIEPAGTNVQSTLGTIQTAVRNLQDTFAAQLGGGIAAAERTRVSREWVMTTNTAASRVPIDIRISELRTAAAPLVV